MSRSQPSVVRSRIALALVSLPLLFSLSGCGTLLFSERRGQEDGKIDPNVAIMDASLLIFYVLPGVVAFIVDYTTGALYLPPDVERGEGPIIGEGGIFE